MLISRAPKREDVPDDAIVSLAEDELEGARLPGLLAARAPASRAIELDATARDEGAEPQHHSVRRDAMRLPRTVLADARDEILEGNEVLVLG